MTDKDKSFIAMIPTTGADLKTYLELLRELSFGIIFRSTPKKHIKTTELLLDCEYWPRSFFIDDRVNRKLLKYKNYKIEIHIALKIKNYIPVNEYIWHLVDRFKCTEKFEIDENFEEQNIKYIYCIVETPEGEKIVVE